MRRSRRASSGATRETGSTAPGASRRCSSPLSLHQEADGALRLRFRGPAREDEVRAALAPLFGDAPLAVATIDDGEALEGKPIRYTSSLAPLAPDAIDASSTFW